LRMPPFDTDSANWTHHTVYSATQALANVAREAYIDAILYHSIRDPIPSCCNAILTPNAFAANQPDNATQTWQLVVTQDEAIWRRGAGDTHSFETSYWA
jgi:hypothetical protein